MERPSAPTTPLAGFGPASTAREGSGRIEGSTMEAPPPKPSLAGFQGAELLARKDNDMIDDARLERRDTAESCLSNFSHQRSNTGWSIAGSTVTDVTDLNSPDVAFTDDPFDSEAGSYSSSPRRSNLLSHPTTSQKRLPFRGPSISCNTDKSRAAPYGSSPDTPASRHRRLEQMTSRKSSLSVYSSAAVPTAGPGPSSRREASPSDTSPPSTAAADDDTQQPVDHESVGDEPRRSQVDPACSPGAQGQEDTGDEIRCRGDPADASVQPEDDASTPREATPDANATEAAEVEADRGIPHEPSSPRCIDVSDVCGQGDGQWTSQPDDSIILEICDQVLQQAFGVQLRDVALAGAVSAAYESVSYCLDELSHVVLNSGLSSTGIVISESARDRTGSGAVPIWPAGDAADSAGASGWDGAGGGSRKRSNGGYDGADSGDGAGDGSPGSGKRQKVSPTQQLPGDMHFSCPFRKRNPLRFNVRDFQACAVQSFPDIPQLKRHVKHFHKQGPLLPFTCQRCGRPMGTPEALKEHVSVGRDQICNPQMVPSSVNPEDGITSGIEEALNGRKAGSKIDCWGTLWRHLFPDDCAIPESDFVPPTELDEVHAQFNSDCCTQQLRQQIQERLGPASDIGTTLAVFSNHIESVIEACRLKTSSVAGGRKRSRAQTPRPMTSRRNSLRLTPMYPAAGGRRGSGRSDSSFSSQVATPNSTNMSGHVEQPSMAEPHSQPHSQPQLHVPYAPPNGSYDGSGVGVAGALMMALAAGGSPGANQGGQPVAVPPPAHIHAQFGSQNQNPVPLSGQLGHPRLLSTDSGLDLRDSFTGQQAADFSSNVHSFGPQYGFSPAPGFEQQPVPDLCLRPSPQEPGMPEMHDEVFSPTNHDMLPSIIFNNFGWNNGNGE